MDDHDEQTECPHEPAAAQETELLDRFRTAQLRQPTGQLPPPYRTPGFAGDAFAAGSSAHIHRPSGAPMQMADMDAIPDDLKQMFVVETRDDLHDLRQVLIRLELDRDLATVREMGGIAHKIKGAAATFGFEVMASLAHTFEDILAIARRPAQALDATSMAVVNRCLDLLDLALEAAATGRDASQVLVEQACALRDALAQEASARPSTPSALPPTPEPLTAPSPLPDTRPLGTGPVESATRASRGSESESFLRIDVRRLDDLMARTSTLATNRASLGRIREEITRFQDEMDHAIARLTDASTQVADLQPILQSLASHTASDADGQVLSGARLPSLRRIADAGSLPRGLPGTWSGSAQGSTTDQLELEQFSELDQALRALSEAVADIRSNSVGLREVLRHFDTSSEAQQALMAEMQQDVTAIRLVPLEELVPRLRLAARQMAQDLHRTIAFSVHGELTQIDRNISEALADPLIQLIRNAIVHGIESAEERAEAGKPECGSVWVRAYYVGNEVGIEVGDDGRGVNPDRLIAEAIIANLLTSEAAKTISRADAMALMFALGLSTLGVAHVSGGRGVGLDEVRTTINRLKGTISVASEMGRGTVFRMRVPISLSVLNVLHVSAAGGQYAIPFAAVQHTISLSAHELTAKGTRIGAQPDALPARSISLGANHARLTGEYGTEETVTEFAAFSLAELLGYEFVPRDPQPTLILDVGHRRIALLVDDAGNAHEVVVRALPQHLRRHAVRGATVTLDGQVLLLLDLAELVADPLEGKSPIPTPRPAPKVARAQAPTVLVVDDSISMRSALESMLTRAGYEVRLARDGFEALDILLESLPQAIVLDIEMPRLDGFELLKVLRRSPHFAGVRVAMLTTKASERHREHALALGADAYLTKPCPDAVLLSTLKRLLVGPPGQS